MVKRFSLLFFILVCVWMPWNSYSARNSYSAASAQPAAFLDEQGASTGETGLLSYAWHTFFPGSSLATQIVTAGDGSVYIVGEGLGFQGPDGQSPLNPFTPGADIPYTDLLVVKLNADGSYRWHTFYGAAYRDVAYDAVVDADGSLYITGQSEEGWLGPQGEPPLHPGAEILNDIFVLKLGPDGNYLWHTFYGNNALLCRTSPTVCGYSREAGYGIALDHQHGL